jgi:hypothetical protein
MLQFEVADWVFVWSPPALAAFAKTKWPMKSESPT